MYENLYQSQNEAEVNRCFLCRELVRTEASALKNWLQMEKEIKIAIIILSLSLMSD